MSLLYEMVEESIKGNEMILDAARSRFEPLKKVYHMVVNKEKVVKRKLWVFYSKDYVMDHATELEIKYCVIDPLHIRVTINLEKGLYGCGYECGVWRCDDGIATEIVGTIELSDLMSDECFKASETIKKIVNSLAQLHPKFRIESVIP